MLLNIFKLQPTYNLFVKLKQTNDDTNDNFPSKLLKLINGVISVLAYHVFCSNTLTLKFRDNWQNGFFIPVSKNSARNSAINYRPIKLPPETSIIFEQILFEKFYQSLKHRVSPEQFDFQSNKCPILQLEHWTIIDYELWLGFRCSLGLFQSIW